MDNTTEKTEEFFNNLFKVMQSYCKWNNIELDSTFLERKLIEEMGEMFQNLLISDRQVRARKFDTVSKEDIEDEMADVLCIIVSLAKVRGVDVVAGAKRKWLQYLDRR